MQIFQVRNSKLTSEKCRAYFHEIQWCQEANSKKSKVSLEKDQAMDKQLIQVGIVGAGKVYKEKHLPALVKQTEAKIVAVCNRSVDSASDVSKKFNIPYVEEDWRSLIKRNDIQAVMIGTWPNMTHEIVMEVIRSGKHVFCQSPIARNLSEARDIVSLANRHPEQVCVACPSLMRIPYESFAKEIIESGEIGEIITVDLIKTSSKYLYTDRVLWSEKRDIIGNQSLEIYSYAETLDAWTHPYESIFAVATTPILEKQDISGHKVKIDTPQIVMISGVLENGAAGVEFHGGIVANKQTPHSLVTIYGTKGTLRYDFSTKAFKLSDFEGALEPIKVPADYHSEWAIEADFFHAIKTSRSDKKWSKGANLSFQDVLKTMQKTEAIYISATKGQRVNLDTL